MDATIKTLTDALKKLIHKLKPQTKALSLLILTGKDNQGMSSVLKQSNFDVHVVEDDECRIFYNQHGIILNLSETWLNTNDITLASAIKKINLCSSNLKLNGLIYCIDINKLLSTKAEELRANISAQRKTLDGYAANLPQKLTLAILFTKLDLLAGFCDFFQIEHNVDTQRALGFAVSKRAANSKLPANFNSQFDSFIETLSQQVTTKVHAIRSNVKRTLIREFPLQMASLRGTITSILKSISPHKYNLRALYFTSSEQGGTSIDRLNSKIKQEYALTLQDQYQHAKNHRAYFVNGALEEFQLQTKQLNKQKDFTHKAFLATIAGISVLGLSFITSHYLKSARILDNVSKELIAYDTLGINHANKDIATFHLSKAYKTLNNISADNISIQRLKANLKSDINQKLTTDFAPALLAELESAIANSNQSPYNKYNALKIYIMLGDKSHAQHDEITKWFLNNWAKNYNEQQRQKKLTLLKKLLKSNNNLSTNPQVITDARNYLNSLPTTYFFYSLVKTNFPKETTPLDYQGFVIGADKIPVYLTKSEFIKIMQKLPAIIDEYQKENWVLGRTDLDELSKLIPQAYAYEYVIFWQNFSNKSHPIHAQNYTDAHALTQVLRESDIVRKLVNIIQNATSPITDKTEVAQIFNKEVASKFSDINIVSDSAVQNLVMTLSELEKFLSTMSVVNDHGRTAFSIARSRFQNDNLANPVSSLFNQADQLPKPLSTWAQQIAGDVWFTIIHNSRDYVNYQWQQQILPEYKNRIAERYPFTNNEHDEISINDFNNFFAKNGTLNKFVNDYVKPFLDTSQANWQLKEVNSYVLPIKKESINELIRANVITNMFFANSQNSSKVDFSLQKINLDPAVASMQLKVGGVKMFNSQDIDDGITPFSWPETGARLTLNAIDGQQYEIEELGPWALFKILQKVNVLVDEQDSSNMQIMFEINGNAGRYILKAQSPVNPFIPGILNEFSLPEVIA